MKKGISFILASLLLLCLLLAPSLTDRGGAGGGVTRVLVISCDDFLTQPDTAPVSENNARIVARTYAAGAKNALVTEKINTIGDPDALASAVRSAFGGAGEEDLNVCYISPHGVLPENGDPAGVALLLSDGKHEGRVSPAALRRILDAAPGHKLLILDACYSGAFVGKGGGTELTNAFASPDYTVITSSGAAEQSWFWSAGGDAETGVGYFTGALAAALDPADGWPADLDRDGRVTLDELKRTLNGLHAVSEIRTWPENGDATVLECASADTAAPRARSAITGLSFDRAALDPLQPECAFSFTVNNPVRLIYRMVPEKDGVWDFDATFFLFDDTEGGGIMGLLSPGYKQRTLSPGSLPDGQGGYVLLQVIGLSGGVPRLYGTHVMCVPASGGVGNAEVRVAPKNDPGGEVRFTVRCGAPCAVSVAILDAEDRVVARPVTDAPTRPEGIRPEGLSLCWDGLDRQGNLLPNGTYRLRVTLKTAEETKEIVSSPFTLSGR